MEYTLNRFDWVIGTRVSGEKPPKGESVPPFTHAREAVRQAVEQEYANGQENVSITVSSHDSGRAEGLREMLEKPGDGHRDDGAGARRCASDRAARERKDGRCVTHSEQSATCGVPEGLGRFAYKNHVQFG